MSEDMKLYTSGEWTVKHGRQQEFIQAWQAFADWTARNQVGAGTGILLQSIDDARKFLSFGPWENLDVIADWRSKSAFQDFIAKARQLCDEIQPQTMQMVADSDPKEI